MEQEIKQIQMGKPHVGILGAGASYTAFLNGDKNSVRLPLMNNFVDILDLNNLLSKTGIDFKTDNFETIYDQLHQNDAHREIRKELEKVIYSMPYCREKLSLGWLHFFAVEREVMNSVNR